MVPNTTVDVLDRLLEIQARDTARDRLRRERDEIPERDALVAVISERARIDSERAVVQAQHDAIRAEEQRHDHEAQARASKAVEVEKQLYSGSVASPRELEALQADVEQLRAQQSHSEDLELDCMEKREALETLLAEIDARRAQTSDSISAFEAHVAAEEARIDGEIASEERARDSLAGEVPPELLADYEQRRGRNRGIGIARLVGNTCAACGLSIPAVEVDRFRHAEPGAICSPDDCECIIVPK